MYQVNPIVNQLLNKHKAEADDIVQSASSNLVKNAFVSSWNQLNKSIIASISSETIMFLPSYINGRINTWISEVELCREEELARYNQIEEPTPEQTKAILDLLKLIDYHILPEYNNLKMEMDTIDNEFANTSRAYRSPLHQALNDINLLYNDIHDIEGDFTGFENVSVYVHGIEDSGDKFLKSAIKASEVGDIIAYENRDGEVEYYVVTLKNGEKHVDEKSLRLSDLKETSEFNDKDGRLHLIYETEYKNEHRQTTSDSLAEKLIDMGLLNDDTMIDMFAHSYGGRRSLQFAMDYPNHVRSLTTIGTPYDKNFLGGIANTFPGITSTFSNKDPKEFSDYLDFNEKNQRTDDGVLHSNVYTDMRSEAMTEDIDHLKVANPEAYQKLVEMEITAAAGRDYSTQFSGRLGISEIKTYDKSDGAVSVKSQHGESLGELIDHNPSFEVRGESIKKPAHSFEIENEAFIELIKQVNNDQKE